jgi:hypothetical protein
MGINSFPPTGGASGFEFPSELIDPVSKFRVSNPENLIDTDFEYGLQPTKWETVELINNTPSFFSKSGDTTIDGISSIITNAGTREIIVKTELDHGLAVGIPINVTGTKSITADGSYIINSIPDTKTFTYLCKDSQPDTASILDLYSSIITGEFFQGSQLRVSDSEGIVTDAAGTSELTVTTNSTHGFGVNTPFYFLNLNSTVAQEFQSANTASKTFDASNSATAQTFDGSNNLSSFNIDWSNSAVESGTVSNVSSTATITSRVTVNHTAENFANLPLGTALYHNVAATGGYFSTNPRGVVFLKTINELGTSTSTFQVSLVPDGDPIIINTPLSGTFQIANQARTFAGNNINPLTQVDIDIISGEEFLFDGGNTGFVGEVDEDGPTASSDNIATVVSYTLVNNETSILVSSEDALEYYVGAMLKYSSTSTVATGLVNNATYFVLSFGSAETAGQYNMTIGELPGAEVINISGGAGTQTFSRIGISLDKDIIHVRNSNFSENAMIQYTHPVSGNFSYQIDQERKTFFFVETKYDEHNYQLSDTLPFQPIVATGGTVTDQTIGDLTFRIHAFTSLTPSTFVVENEGTDGLAEILVVAGGGGGGGSFGAAGGGGAGGLVYHSSKVLEPGTYNVTVGAGGIGGTTNTGDHVPTSTQHGRPGGNSSFDNIIAQGGGGGNQAFYSPSQAIWLNGGSGGGGGDYYEPFGTNWRGGLATQGNSGGGLGYGFPGGSRGPGGPSPSEDGAHGQPHEGAGGGGAGGTSTGGSSGAPSNGGIGRQYPQFAPYGSPVGWFAGGGGGGQHYQALGTQTNSGVGGFFGGGGLGADERALNNGSGARRSTVGASNTGGGGGGGATNYGGGPIGPAANGGTGIVIVRYPLTIRDSKFITATGGTITNVFENGTLYAVHSFTGVGGGTFEVQRVGLVPSNNTIEYLVVAGGGGGGNDMGGGGGAGGFLEGSFSISQVGSYTTTVGNGGAGARAGTDGPRGDNGQNSSIVGGSTSIIAFGGGGGASDHDNAIYPAGGVNNGQTVGSGGGGSGGANNNSGSGYGGSRSGTGTPGQGFNGAGGAGAWFPGGGGGAGQNGSANPGKGGDGKPSSILGPTYWFAGGGGGSGYSSIGGNGGRGGGGGGAVLTTFGGPDSINPASGGGGGGPNSQTNTPGGNAAVNSGGGGGGGSHFNSNNFGGRGGSGIVVLRYPIATPIGLDYMAAQGGEVSIYVENGIRYAAHSFKNVGTSNFVVSRLGLSPINNNVDVLVVAGGGSGGVDNGGGGGAGGVVDNNVTISATGSYPIVVGAGGASRPGVADDGPGNPGSNSTAFGRTALGGAGGTGWSNPALPPNGTINGGSGSGQSASNGALNPQGRGLGLQPTSASGGFGNNGGTAVVGRSGGGGGAGGVGGSATSTQAGSGGIGRNLEGKYGPNVGTSGFVAAGGTGGWDVASGFASNGHVSNNGVLKVGNVQSSESPAPPNTGHGGHGANHNNQNSGAGGSGIVIIRYPIGVEI